MKVCIIMDHFVSTVDLMPFIMEEVVNIKGKPGKVK